jgi:large subunit ribosomal protein L18
MASGRRAQARSRRKQRVRKKIRGTGSKPRLSVFRSAKHIYAQLIDDGSAHTILEASSLSKDLRANLGGSGGNKEGAAIIGKSVAEKALEKGIKKVVFDRNGFLYHGRIKALADAAREAGLEF